jgi:hypothetical protein
MHIWIFDTYYVYNMYWNMYWAYLGEAQRLFLFWFSRSLTHQAAPLIPSKKVLEHQITVCEPSIRKDVKHSSIFLCHDSLVCGLDGAVRPNELGNKFRIASHVLDLVQFGEIFAQEVATITAAAIKEYSFTGNIFSSRLVAMIHAIIHHGLLSLVRSPG